MSRRVVRSDRCWRGKNGRVGAERGTALPGSRGLTPLTFVVRFHQVRLDVSVVRASHDHRSRDDQGQSPGECEHGARSALPLLVHDEVLATCTRTRVPTPWARGLSPGARSIHDLLSRAPVSPHDPSLLASRAAPRASMSASVPRHYPSTFDIFLNSRRTGRCTPRKSAPPDLHSHRRETHCKVARVEVRSITTPWVRSVTGALSQPGARASLADGRATSRTWRRRPIR